MKNTAKFLKEIIVSDPDSNAPVHVSIFKHDSSGAIFGVDSSFLSNTDEPVYDPFYGRKLAGEDFEEIE